MPYANNKCADSLRIRTFVVRCLDSTIPLLAIAEISRPYLISLAEQAGLSLTWSKIPKKGFLVTRPIMYSIKYTHLIKTLADCLIDVKEY